MPVAVTEKVAVFGAQTLVLTGLAEIAGFEFALNRFDHYAVDAQVYTSPWSNLRDNLHRKWVVDNDAFATNQFLHPYQGSLYHGFARSAGLGIPVATSR